MDDQRVASGIVHVVCSECRHADALAMADQAYDTGAVRERIQARGAVPDIRSKRKHR